MRRRMLFPILAALIGAAVGAYYYALSWEKHLPYIGLKWLGPLLHADGEAAYDAMQYESMIDFGVIACFLWLAGDLLWHKLRMRSKAAH